MQGGPRVADGQCIHETPPSAGFANNVLIAHDSVSRNPEMRQVVAQASQCCTDATHGFMALT